MDPLETTQQWRDVVALKPPASLGELFATSSERVQSMTLRVGSLLIDYSKQLLDPKIIEALLSVSLERDVASAFRDMAAGQAINVTERRAVGHMVLRSPKGQRSLMNGIDVAPEVHATLDRMAILATAVAGLALGLLALTYATDMAGLIAFAALHGLGWDLRGPFMSAIRADYFGRHAIGVILGLSAAIAAVGQMAGPLVAGVLADLTGDYRLGFTLLAILSALGSLAFMLATRPGQKEAGQAPVS